MKTKIIFGTFLLIISISTFAQTEKKETNNNVTEQHIKDISQSGLQGFIKMDLKLLAFLPTKKDYRNVFKRLNQVPKETLRYIDSLDIKRHTKDTLHVKVYSQNYAYLSQNTYVICKKKTGDNLWLRNMHIDLKMKSKVPCVGIYRKLDFDLHLTSKKLNEKSPSKRIIFSKNFQ